MHPVWDAITTGVSADDWQGAGQRRALDTFFRAAKCVPAYADFLAAHSVDVSGIHTWSDVEAYVPVTTKENYISQYPLTARCWDGILPSSAILSYSSGSSGEPTLWPRSSSDEDDAAVLHDVLLRETFRIHERKTLIVVAFAFGAHIAGIATVAALNRLMQYGYPFTYVTPGKQLPDVVDVVERLGAQFEQVIFFGHPGFVKEVLTVLHTKKYQWTSQHVGCIVSGNGFFEAWREYVLELLGDAAQPESIVSLYGCTDMGALAFETPMSIAYRQSIRGARTGEREPFTFQVIPTLRYVESVDGELVFTVPSAAPAIRYSMHDRGAVVPFETVKKHTPGVHGQSWPVVELFGRERTIIINGANIYSEHIQRALEQSVLSPHVTGRFLHAVLYSSTMDEEFVLDVELRAEGEAMVDSELIRGAVISALIEYNSEYADCVRALGEKVHPRVRVHPRGAAIFNASSVGKKKL